MITTARLVQFASGRIAAQENAQKGTTNEEVRTLGFICMVAVMRNTLYSTERVIIPNFLDHCQSGKICKRRVPS